MKIRTRNMLKIETNHAVSDVLRRPTVFKSHRSTLTPQGFQTVATLQNPPQKLIEREAERRQLTGRVYVSMLPPR